MCKSCLMSNREYTVIDPAGKSWRFETHHFCGPIILRQDGEPRTRQPGSRSLFWPAFEAWQNDHSRLGHD